MSEVEPSSKPPGGELAQTGVPASSDRRPGRVSRNPEALKMVTQEVVEELQLAMRSGPMPNPLLEKGTPEHIDQLLKAEDRDNEREHERFKIRNEVQKERIKLEGEREKARLQARIQ